MGCTDTVSSGRAPIAFSISAVSSSVLSHCWRLRLRLRLRPRLGWVSPTSQAAQAKLVNLVNLFRKLPVILDDVDIVGAGQQSSKSRVARVPERGRDDAYQNAPVRPVSQSRGASPLRPVRLTILDQDIQALLDEEVVVEDNEPEREREDVVAGSDLEEFADASLSSLWLAPAVLPRRAVRRRDLSLPNPASAPYRGDLLTSPSLCDCSASAEGKRRAQQRAARDCVSLVRLAAVVDCPRHCSHPQ